MSQYLVNIIELLRTVNEVYFITAPERVRAAYILVDDLVELSLKTFLYDHTLSQREQCRADFQAAGLLTSNAKRRALDTYFEGRTDLATLATKLNSTELAVRQRLASYQHTSEQQVNCKAELAQLGWFPTLAEEQAFDDYFVGTITLADFATALNQQEDTVKSQLAHYGDLLRHWSVNEPDQHVGFHTAVTDIKALFPANSTEGDMLQAALDRHEGRNRLYHDHHHTPWSISDIRCLQALCDLFELLETLFPDFNDMLKASPDKTVGCQIGVLRLKLKAEQGQSELVEPYLKALQQLKNEHAYGSRERGLEHSVIHKISDSFFRALRTEYTDAVAKLELRVNELDTMMHDPHRKRKEHPAEYSRKSHSLVLFKQQLSEIEALLGTP